MRKRIYKQFSRIGIISHHFIRSSNEGRMLSRFCCCCTLTAYLTGKDYILKCKGPGGRRLDSYIE